MMIAAIFLLGLSELSIEITELNLLETSFIMRTAIFTKFNSSNEIVGKNY